MNISENVLLLDAKNVHIRAIMCSFTTVIERLGSIVWSWNRPLDAPFYPQRLSTIRMGMDETIDLRISS